MTNYNYRKYEGAPHSEKKKTAPKEPSKLAKRGKKRRKDIVCVSAYQLERRNARKWDFWEGVPCLHVGEKIRLWGCYSAMEYVVKRMKANILRDTRTKVLWVESKIFGTVSPEFHDFENIMNWLVFKGLEEGWLYVETFTNKHWKTGEKYRVTRLARQI